MYVLKFGGSSVSSPERIRHVAGIIKKHRERGPLAVVVSAMGDSTDELLKLAAEVSDRYSQVSHRRELDMLLTTGERVSMSLLAMALLDQGVPAVSLTGSQSGIITDHTHGDARIVELRPHRVLEVLNSGNVAIVAGFQGVSATTKEITTLGRGGSDTTAVALGAALGAQEVFIYTDVDGVFETDPRIVDSALRLPELPMEMALGAAKRGAVVLHPRCVESALNHRLRVRVLSSLKPAGEWNSGTLLVPYRDEHHRQRPWIWTLDPVAQGRMRLSVFGRGLIVSEATQRRYGARPLGEPDSGFESEPGAWTKSDLKNWIESFKASNTGPKSESGHEG